MQTDDGTAYNPLIVRMRPGRRYHFVLIDVYNSLRALAHSLGILLVFLAHIVASAQDVATLDVVFAVFTAYILLALMRLISVRQVVSVAGEQANIVGPTPLIFLLEWLIRFVTIAGSVWLSIEPVSGFPGTVVRTIAALITIISMLPFVLESWFRLRSPHSGSR